MIRAPPRTGSVTARSSGALHRIVADAVQGFLARLKRLKTPLIAPDCRGAVDETNGHSPADIGSALARGVHLSE